MSEQIFGQPAPKNELETAKLEIELLKMWLKQSHDNAMLAGKLVSEYAEALQSENKALREVLEFYADKENWTVIRDGEFYYSTPEDTDEEPLTGDSDDDRVVAGKRARLVLAQWKVKV